MQSEGPSVGCRASQTLTAGAVLARLTCDPWEPDPSAVCSSPWPGTRTGGGGGSSILILGKVTVPPHPLQVEAQISKTPWPSQDVTLLLGAVPALCQLQPCGAHCVTLQERGALTTPWQSPIQCLGHWWCPQRR